MLELIARPWPWYVAGPLIGLMVPALLLLGKSFGISSTLRHVCAAVPASSSSSYFRYDWKKSGGWNLVFALGVVLGGVISAILLPDPGIVHISDATTSDLTALGLQDLDGLVPGDLISWGALLTPAGFISVVVGGFLVGFGARYAGGCTSGHAISGMAALQLPSLIAVIGFFAGGLLVTHLLLPLLL